MFVKNPLTNRKIKIGGATYLALVDSGVIDDQQYGGVRTLSRGFPKNYGLVTNMIATPTMFSSQRKNNGASTVKNTATKHKDEEEPELPEEYNITVKGKWHPYMYTHN